jgi:hypothetical protein
MVVQSAPSDPEREDEYNNWYASKHLPQVCAVPGIVAVRRYKVRGGGDGQAPEYVAIYELDADDLTGPMRELRARSASGQIHISDVLRLDPPPVVTLYEQID